MSRFVGPSPYRRFLWLALAVLLLAPPVRGESSGTFLDVPLMGTDHRMHRLDDWRGKLRVVNFWATWCQPCRSEIPVLGGAYQAWRKQGVEIIGVALDNADDVGAFAHQAGIAYPLLLANEQGPTLMQDAGNHSGALPFTLLVDAQGRVLQRHVGPIDARRLTQWLQEATSHKKPSAPR